MTRFVLYVLLASCTKPQPPTPPAAECLPPVAGRPIQLETDSTFPIGPAVTYVSQSSATIMFEAEERCEGRVRWSEAGQGLSATAPTTLAEREVVHTAKLEGLRPGIRHEYQVEACGKTSRVLSFFSAPPPRTPVRFGVLGDNRSFPEDAKRVARALAQMGPDFIVHTGDVVTDGNKIPEWREQFYEPMRSLISSVPTYIAIGNHEENAKPFYEYTSYPYDPIMTDHAQFGSNFSVTYGNVFLLFVDTNSLSFLLSVALDTDLAKWIQAQVASEAAKRATWRVAVGHHPAFTESWSPGACDRYSGTPPVLGFLFPLMEKHGFQLYLTGHTHAYERGEKRGVTQIISGGGGAALDEVCRDLPETAVVVPEYHYLEVDAGCDKLRVRAVSVPPDAGAAGSTVAPAVSRVLDELSFEPRAAF